MRTIPVTINLPPALIHDLRRIAVAQDDAPGDMIRSLLLREVARHRSETTQKPSGETDGAGKQRALADEIAAATSWADMELRLARRGVSMTRSVHGFTLHDPSGTRICRIADLGFPHDMLARRFGAEAPGGSGPLQQPAKKKVAEVNRGDRSDPVGLA